MSIVTLAIHTGMRKSAILGLKWERIDFAKDLGFNARITLYETKTLESLERIPEAMEAYRWLRREAPQYRDVAMRIESLSMRRMHRDNL